MRTPRETVSALILSALLAGFGCYNTPVDTSDYTRGPAPLRFPSPAKEEHACCYEDALTGGEIFKMYCSYCHNAPSLAERPFSQFRNVAAHMRVADGVPAALERHPAANATGRAVPEAVHFLPANC
jgi:hypothetical protein